MAGGGVKSKGRGRSEEQRQGGGGVKSKGRGGGRSEEQRQGEDE